MLTCNVFAQSVIIIDNPETKPVPVKITNTPSGIQEKIPFTEQSPATTQAGIAYGKLTVKAGASETKVIEFMALTAVSSISRLKVRVDGRTYRFFMPQTGGGYNAYSGILNIVLRNGATAEFEFEFAAGNEERYIMVSGYSLR